MDHITIDNLEIIAHHGVLPEEKSLGQKFIISAKLYFDMCGASLNDALDRTINYAEVCRKIGEYAESNSFDLIETLAENTARMLLIRYQLLKRAEITIKKPWAPIGMHLDGVSVVISRGWHDVYLAIGSNMGDKKAHLDYAVNAISRNEYFRNVTASSYITTKAYGVTDQDDFLNGVIKAETICEPYELLELVNGIEKERGRQRLVHWGPRTLDIDILFEDDIIINGSRLTIPHCDIKNRDFVLAPMCELAPDYIHPLYRKSMRELYEELKAKEDTAVKD